MIWENMKEWLLFNKVHVLVWLLFIFYEAVIVFLLFGLSGHPLTYLFHYTVVFCFFYFHSNSLLPWLEKSKRRLIFYAPLLIIIELACYIMFHYFMDLLLMLLQVIEPKPYPLDKTFILRNIYRGIFFFGFSTGYFFFRNFLRSRRRTELLEKEKLQNIIHRQQAEQEVVRAQNAYLKAQINPHFLFNTLDFVYSKVEETAPAAAQTIVCLSQMMRYAIDSDNADGFIQLGEEISQVENLIYLHQVRKGFKMEIDFYYTQEAVQLRFIPLVLLTLVENIFKHGDLHSPGHSAQVTLAVVEGSLYMETINLIDKTPAGNKTGTGLGNIEKRLYFTYGSKCAFSYGAVPEGHFRTELTVPVDALREPVRSEVRSADIDKGSLHEYAG